MSKGIRNLVSKRKRRFKEDGYDLDLSYITDRLIAMGYPAQKFEGVYRNHIDEVCRFLEDKHKDHYRIYNLCSEKNRSYDEARFHNRVRNFPFADHNPPPLMDIEPLCKDMAEWLEDDPKNVAVVHCKAGKGRTGVMICCYLLHCRSKLLAQEALDFYGDRRTLDRKGVTIPSQQRYVHYYGQLVASNFNYNPPFVSLRQARMNAPLSSVNSEVYLTISSHTNKKGYSSQPGDIRKGKEWIHLPVREEDARPMSEDIKIELKRTSFVRRTEKLFSAWLNTHFILEEGKKVTNGCDINTSDQNNHNTPNIRQRSNSFRLAKRDSFRRKRSETAELRAPLTGLGGGGGSHGGKNRDECKDLAEYKESSEKKIEESGSKSLPTGHLSCLTDEEWTPNGSRSPPPRPRVHNRHRRRHHTQNLPMCGSARDSWDSEARSREQEVQTILTKNQLDKANKDTHHKLLPKDFQIELWWLVTFINKGGSNALESRESGSTPSTITPSGSSSDEDDDDDDDEEEGSDWDSDGHCPERYVGRYRLMSDCSAAHPNHYTMPEGPT
ncbi:phosphatidylinositol 3,4,5-trisphosphate 3-phosphatase and dual-specificity protein phosphatase PTEN-like isoform X4 [Palaemon carinicauda]|uniref:phosphatidylinositol 3,4,5-trisphosphate 3-phosphatase and dual-specificity protein phosphatase PTEN-like isoform X4 n=1 Tax=Palaemon carinicauda TaxID=392227 RepID=UPI0035B5848C